MLHVESVVEQPPNRATPFWKVGAQVILAVLILVAMVLVAVETKTARSVNRTDDWPEAVLVIAAAAGSLLGLSRQLPAQNVLLAGFIVGGVGWLTNAIGVAASIPLGPIHYTAAAGPRLPGAVPWWIPLVWIIVVLNSRGVARLMLRRRRHGPGYGLSLITLTVVLSLVLDLGLEPFAARLKCYWLWDPTQSGPTWYGTPLTQFAGWMVTALLAQIIATPALINKRPVKCPPEYHPLGLWALLNLFFAAVAMARDFWLVAGLSAGSVLVTALLAARQRTIQA